MTEPDNVTEPNDAPQTERVAIYEPPPRETTMMFDTGVDGVKRASATVLSREKISVTMENMYGQKLVIRGDLRSLLEVTYAIDFAIEQATRRESARRAY